ncbi:MAG: PEP-CTERM-box response regulator transcription factor [Halofilum sp. (in: g-proteobacteria)]|nr:PEP-CTERM-box response regulator transcription factor [Halofilum sp. (in: g-proteobacteria)]
MSNTERTILVVEDDAGIRKQVRWAFDDYEVVEAKDREEAINRLRRHEPAVVTLDLGLPPDPGGASEGLATLQQILELAPRTRVIVITGNEDRAHAVEAVGMGAHDFYQKPLDPDLLRVIVERTFRLCELEQENRRLSAQQSGSPLAEIIGTSATMDRVRRQIEKIAPSLATTCLLGESGTGKELVARALHRLSARADKPFVALNCAAIPENLLESELFGYEKGAFTGAHQQTKGKIEHADGGTLFLDEIGDLPHNLQSKLLRFLQERTVERVGARKEIPVDVRVVSATNKDLDGLMADGGFREDLYYRLCEVTIRIPPLREREGDAGVIARHLLDALAAEQRQPVPVLTPSARRAIESYAWPGNVRELANRLKRAVIMAEGPRITEADLELEAPEDEVMPLNLREVREQAERRALARALEHAGDNLSRASGLLGITRPTLYSLLDKYDMRPERSDAADETETENETGGQTG